MCDITYRRFRIIWFLIYSAWKLNKSIDLIIWEQVFFFLSISYMTWDDVETGKDENIIRLLAKNISCRLSVTGGKKRVQHSITESWRVKASQSFRRCISQEMNESMWRAALQRTAFILQLIAFFSSLSVGRDFLFKSVAKQFSRCTTLGTHRRYGERYRI